MPNAHARPLPHTAGTRVCTRWSSKLYCILNLSKAKYNEKCGYLWMCIYFGWSRYSESARYLSHKRTHLASMTQYQMNLHLYTCVFWVARSRTRLFLSSRFLLFFYDCMLYVCRLMISSSTQPYECIWCRPPFWIADDKQRKMNAKKAITHTHTHSKSFCFSFVIKYCELGRWIHRAQENASDQRWDRPTSTIFVYSILAFGYRKIHKPFSLLLLSCSLRLQTS